MQYPFKKKGISVIHYVEITGQSKVRYCDLGCYYVESRSVHRSIERTVKMLWRKGAIARFKHTDRMFHYCITPFGRDLLKRQELGKT